MASQAPAHRAIIAGPPSETKGAQSFGPYELDFDRYELRVDGQPVAVEPRTFDLVALLLRNRGRTVTRDEIFREIWPGQLVSDAALSSQIRSARKALGDDGKRQAVIATVHGRGFRLRRRTGTPDLAAPQAAAAGRCDLFPCVAVLPCSAPGGDGRGTVIAEGLTEDLINALARNRWMRVVTRNAAFALGRSGEPIDEILTRLNADYAVTGSVRLAGDRVRVTIQLTETSGQRCIWSERFDRRLLDILDLQDELSGLVAARIASQLGLSEQKRAGRLRPGNLGAWELYQLGSAEFYRFTAVGNRRCQELMRQSIARAPEFAEPQARLAYAMVLESVYFDGRTDEAHLDEALRLADRAVALDDQEANNFFALGRVHLARGDCGLAIEALETALALNPCHALSHCGLGDSLVSDGRPEAAIPCFARALALSPQDPFRWAFMSYRSLAHMFMDDPEGAVHWARSATLVPNAHYWARAKLISWLAHSGDLDGARAGVPALMRARPGFSCDFARSRLFFVRVPEHLEVLLDGLRRAGVP
ncbi:winged helix-turn-helix domain-containing tetratricopeptide repeat protein [Maritimibacter sp. HL-12]|uniref:winged helix-turn-helix domain-containing tetratricopeptide repeat protein n=1 Tax=Maritimibacter sp. HL-12 TaxID=1162418 RepID=UPI000A0EEFF7|nr:winged helix-turn-helix domain-containing protein [Maritimibacter sp. HL-12]SMH51186.1 TolB amino-terminal domain-containing protein [Maritimibacter sp. HL-12]